MCVYLYFFLLGDTDRLTVKPTDFCEPRWAGGYEPGVGYRSRWDEALSSRGNRIKDKQWMSPVRLDTAFTTFNAQFDTLTYPNWSIFILNLLNVSKAWWSTVWCVHLHCGLVAVPLCFFWQFWACVRCVWTPRFCHVLFCHICGLFCATLCLWETGFGLRTVSLFCNIKSNRITQWMKESSTSNSGMGFISHQTFSWIIIQNKR